jgi:hypothetical protein
VDKLAVRKIGINNKFQIIQTQEWRKFNDHVKSVWR